MPLNEGGGKGILPSAGNGKRFFILSGILFMSNGGGGIPGPFLKLGGGIPGAPLPIANGGGIIPLLMSIVSANIASTSPFALIFATNAVSVNSFLSSAAAQAL